MWKKSRVHKITVWASKQLEQNKNLSYIAPPIGFDALTTAYENSFIIGWIVERIGTSAGVGFKETGNKELDALLQTLDVESIVKSFIVTGNYFLEMAFSLGNKLTLFPFITAEVKLDKDRKLIQETNWGKAEFLPEQYIQLKRPSLSSRYYWESMIGRCVQQIILLQNIDKFYAKLFERWLLASFILADKANSISPDDKKAIEAILEDVFSGVDNAFHTGVISADLTKIDLSGSVDNQHFLELRKQAEKDISIALNFPYDLLNSENSNRSISEVSLESLNTYITKPTLLKIANQLREPLRKYFGASVDEIAFHDVDVKNQKEEMEVITGYVREGVWTANEAREMTGKEAHTDWDTLKSRDVTPQDIQQSIAASVQKMYKKKQ